MDKYSKNHEFIITRLRDNQLSNLIKPFKDMVKKNKSGDIKIHLMTWKVIMLNIHDDTLSRKDLYNFFVSYFVLYGILFVPKVKQKQLNTKERVKEHRKDRKDLGYKSINIQLPPDVYAKLQRYKKQEGLTYSEALAKLLSSIYIKP